MKKWMMLALALLLALTAAFAMAEDAQGPKLVGSMEDGCYVVRVPVDNEAGEWNADHMADEAGVVTLVSAQVVDGVYTVKVAPGHDGDASVALRHMTDGVCDQLHGFELHVENGAISSNGGSFTASPSADDLAPWLCREWVEKDTQFTTMTIHRNLLAGGFDAEMTSPVSHGAWVVRAHIAYDCEAEALVYTDGARYEIGGNGVSAKASATGLAGKLTLQGSDEQPSIVWSDEAVLGADSVTFEHAADLPAFAYTGEDPVEAALTAYMAKEDWAGQYLRVPGACVGIPAPVVIATEKPDDDHMTVYANLWILNYQKMGSVLECVSGGECPCVVNLEKDGEGWKVASLTAAGDGNAYAEDIKRFAHGDQSILDGYYAATDLSKGVGLETRERFIRMYVDAANLTVDAYQDYGWDPVPLNK